MSRVQSIERAFAVLGALADGPIGVTEVADRPDLPKSTAARLLASLAREGVVEQVPGDTRYRLGPRLVTLAARVRPSRSLAALARPSLAELAARPARRPGLASATATSSTTSTRSDTPEPGLGPRLDRLADPAPRGVVRAGPARVPAADARPALPRPRRWSRSRARTLVTRRRAARAAARDPARRLHLGARGVRRGHLVGGGADRRRVGRGRRRGPRPRPVVPLPAAGRETDIGGAGRRAAARISGSLRAGRLERRRLPDAPTGRCSSISVWASNWARPSTNQIGLDRLVADRREAMRDRRVDRDRVARLEDVLVEPDPDLEAPLRT